MTTTLWRMAAAALLWLFGSLGLTAQTLKFSLTHKDKTYEVGSAVEPAQMAELLQVVRKGAPDIKLAGDLRENAEWLQFAPAHTLTFLQEKELLADPQKPYRAKIVVRGKLSQNAFEYARREFARQSPIPEKAAFVTVIWVVNGMAVRTKLMPFPHEGAVFDVAFRLSADEARGSPMLAFVDGSKGWIKPAPLFDDPSVQAALVAAMWGNPDEFGGHLAKTPGLASQKAVTGLSFLHYLAQTDFAESMRRLLSADPDAIKVKLKEMDTPLHHAARHGRAETVKLLLAGGADKNATDDQRCTALLFAAQNGHLETVEVLLKEGADDSIKSSDNRTPFTEALDRGYLEILQAVTRKTPAYFEDSVDNQGVLATQARLGHTGVVRWLLGKKISPNSTRSGISALNEAVWGANPDIVALLIAAKAKVDWPEPNSGATPLHIAALKGDLVSAEALLSAGAAVNVTDKHKRTPLHYAAAGDRAKVADLLLVNGGDAAAVSRDGHTALALALKSQNVSTVEVLVKHGAKIDVQSPGASDALESAVIIDHPAIVEKALADGWPIDKPIRDTWSLAQLAKTIQAKKCLDVLQASHPDALRLASAAEVSPAKSLQAVPKLLTGAMPDDPRQLRESFEESSVRVEMIIDQEGRVVGPKIAQTPDSRLSNAVLEAVRTWRFSPAQIEGKAVAARVQLPVVFAASEKRVYALRNLGKTPEATGVQARPEYPFEERRRGTSGRVVLQFVVSPSGDVVDIRVIETTGLAFARQAVAAVAKWKYKPGQINGRPVYTRMQIPIIFSVTD